jgi:hypothetical protein
MDRMFLPFTPRFITFTLAVIATLAIIIVMATTGASGVGWWLCLSAVGGLSTLGVYDLLQQRHAILRNSPSPRIFASSSRRSAARCGNTSLKARRTAPRSAATSGRSSISAPRRNSPPRRPGSRRSASERGCAGQNDG